MPTVVAYSTVVETMGRVGARCVYPNGGAFDFEDRSAAMSVGWIGPEDPTIRPEAMHLVRRVREPYEANLARLLVEAWRRVAPGPVWVMPKSHWAYELRFGSREWMQGLLDEVGLDAKALEAKSEADAIEFLSEERVAFERFARRLLERLEGSDFAVAFPGAAVLCALHHHKQVWWTTTDARVLAEIDAVFPRAS